VSPICLVVYLPSSEQSELTAVEQVEDQQREVLHSKAEELQVADDAVRDASTSANQILAAMSAIKETRARNKRDLDEANHEALIAQSSAAAVNAASVELYARQRDIKESLAKLTSTTSGSCKLGQMMGSLREQRRRMEESEE
jgi:hypothetical protein